MSMSTHIVGFVPPNDEWTAKTIALEACRAAGVKPPEELERFLGLDPGEGQAPDPNGREVDLDASPGVAEYRADMRDGYEIDLLALRKARPEVAIIRVFNSY